LKKKAKSTDEKLSGAVMDTTPQEDVPMFEKKDERSNDGSSWGKMKEEEESNQMMMKKKKKKKKEDLDWLDGVGVASDWKEGKEW